MDPAEEIADALRGEPIAAAWLFGSRARGTAGPLSDADVAILPRAGLAPDARFVLIGRVAHVVEHVFGVTHADVVLVDEAPPHIAFAAISGRLVIENDPEQRWQREARIMSEYHDRRFADEQWLAMTKERYARGEFA